MRQSGNLGGWGKRLIADQWCVCRKARLLNARMSIGLGYGLKCIHAYPAFVIHIQVTGIVKIVVSKEVRFDGADFTGGAVLDDAAA